MALHPNTLVCTLSWLVVMKLFIVDFSESTVFKRLFTENNLVGEENTEGGRAYKAVLELMPDAIFMNYDHKPKHALETASAIKKRKKTAHIPIFFIHNETTDPSQEPSCGKMIRSEDIEYWLNRLSNSNHTL